MFSTLLQVRRDGFELVGLGFVADGDVGFEAGLVAEQLVVVGLVGADGDVERRVEIHPGDVAGVIVVGEEGVGAQGQEFLERGVVGERGGFAQEARGLLKIGGVGLVVGDEGEFLVGIAPDDGEESDGLFALRRGQGFDPGFELLAGHVRRIEIGAQRLALGHAGDEGGVIVEIAPGAFVEPEIVQALLAEGRGVLLQFGVEVAIAAPELVHEQVVEHAGGFDQFGQGFTVAGGERGGIVLRGHGRETRAHLFQLIQIGHNGSGGQQHEKVLHLVYCGTGQSRKIRPPGGRLDPLKASPQAKLPAPRTR